ncbi:hypothetical protein K505DRAFT_111449 [Melanomma pulvis-pyrius CBS 109.77]|uniref:Uncharacterized protein n=1 Tax=Melanomma pulvis-pyrius CBS 109.77 TaxID=1314802 RepID=A0A6A6WVR6_9PLEO|nr:hypothetical protein K505DRAFT_111449 [Melanomma pulvis-pyrius CBS 109.77]
MDDERRSRISSSSTQGNGCETPVRAGRNCYGGFGRLPTRGGSDRCWQTILFEVDHDITSAPSKDQRCWCNGSHAMVGGRRWPSRAATAGVAHSSRLRHRRLQSLQFLFFPSHIRGSCRQPEDTGTLDVAWTADTASRGRSGRLQSGAPPSRTCCRLAGYLVT